MEIPVDAGIIADLQLQPRRQAVRHLTLTQAFGGSNPSGAAKSAVVMRKALPPARANRNPPQGGFPVSGSRPGRSGHLAMVARAFARACARRQARPPAAPAGR